MIYQELYNDFLRKHEQSLRANIHQILERDHNLMSMKHRPRYEQIAHGVMISVGSIFSQEVSKHQKEGSSLDPLFDSVLEFITRQLLQLVFAAVVADRVFSEYGKNILKKIRVRLPKDVRGSSADDLALQTLAKLHRFLHIDQKLRDDLCVLRNNPDYRLAHAVVLAYQSVSRVLNIIIRNTVTDAIRQIYKHNELDEHLQDCDEWDEPFDSSIDHQPWIARFLAFAKKAELTDRDIIIIEMRTLECTFPEIAERTESTVDAIKSRWKKILRPKLKDMFSFFTNAWFFPRTIEILGHDNYHALNFSHALYAKLESSGCSRLADAFVQSWESSDDDIHEIEIPDEILGDFQQWLHDSLAQPFLGQYPDLSFRNTQLNRLKQSWQWGYALWSSSVPGTEQPPPTDPPASGKDDRSLTDKKDTSVKSRKPRTKEQKEAEQILQQIMFETWFGTDDDQPEPLSPEDQILLDHVWEKFQQQISTLPPQFSPSVETKDIEKSWATLLKQHTVEQLDHLMRQVHWLLSPPVMATATAISSDPPQHFSVSLRQDFPIQGEIRKIEIEVVQHNQLLLLGHRLLDTESHPPHDTISLAGTLRFRRKSDARVVLEHPVTLQLRLGKQETSVERLPSTPLQELPLEQMIVEWDFA